MKTFTCSECGKSYTEAIPTVAHSYEAVVTAPTCDKMGYTTYTCSVCGDSYVADYVDAAGHDCETETVPATCLGYGFVRESCKHCDYSVITEITAPLGHDYQAVVTAPTLDEGGYTTHTCSRCGDSYVDSETPALGHKCAAYTDIPTDWAKEGICFVIENGLMVGTTSTTFAPKDTLTRAMLVTVLYRMAGSRLSTLRPASRMWLTASGTPMRSPGPPQTASSTASAATSSPRPSRSPASSWLRSSSAMPRPKRRGGRAERLSRCRKRQHLRQRRHGMGRFHGPRYRLEGSGRHLPRPAGPCGPRAGGCHPHALRKGKLILHLPLPRAPQLPTLRGALFSGLDSARRECYGNGRKKAGRSPPLR